MSDYKELIEALRGGYPVNFDDDGFTMMHIPSDYEKQAADAIEQLVKERDAAVAAAENIHSDFVDYACSGRNNIAPYCGNICADCTDAFGLCIPQSKFCKGFISEEYTDWRGVKE